MPEKINIHGVMIDNVNMNEALDIVLGMLKGKSANKIYTPNAEIIMQANRDPELLNILNSADLLVPDGAGVILASRMLRCNLKEKVSGIDLVKKVLSYTEKKPVSFFIFGGRPGVAEKASINILSDFPRARINGFRNGYFEESEIPDIIKQINESRADVLLVGLGAPKQEKWIHRYAEQLNAKVIMGIGGTIDIFAGTAALAPEFMRKAGLEWLFRLIKEPRRYKRMMDLPRFMLLTLKKRFQKNR
jgi:N-acetylglucosaminyldiphosphoundecaprenol N-acetyl-beta-D-mannosaminyltransferase